MIIKNKGILFAMLCIIGGQTADAKTQYQKALEINPKSKIAQDALAELNKTSPTKAQ